MAYKIRITRDGFEFEAEGDKKFVLDMLNRFDKGKTTVLPEGTSKKNIESSKEDNNIKSISAGEFIRKAGFKKHTDIVLAFGYYLENHSGLSSFAPSDINKCYYESKMEPSNTHQSVIYLIRKGFLMESKDKKADKGWNKYTLTSTGVDFIEKRLSQSGTDK